MSFVEADPLDVRRAREAPGLLRAFNDAGVLGISDVHVAVRLSRFGAVLDEWVLLAAAFAARAPRLGHVCVDLSTIRATAAVDTEEAVDLETLPWPAVEEWRARVAASSSLVAVSESDLRPLRLEGSLLYLDRYWCEERAVASDIAALRDAPVTVSVDVLDGGLDRLFASDSEITRQRLAAEAAVRGRFTVVAGGPGTGKTTTVARIVALLHEQGSAPLVALAAPTGKAAARLEEAVHESASALDVSDAVRASLLGLSASTLHRLLGWRPGSHSRFRHHRGNRLPHDVVIVDETSMVSLSLMARLLEAVRADARLILIGDPGQLTSIEAGAVLGDVVGDADEPAGGIVVLDRVHRYGEDIARVAEAIRRGDAAGTLDALRAGGSRVTWIETDAAAGASELEEIRADAVASAKAVVSAALAGDGTGAIAALGKFRVLCAHRRGDHGVAAWQTTIQRWIAEALPGYTGDGEWFIGRPLLVTENDYGLKLYNGDTGVIIAGPEGVPLAAFERRGEIVTVRPSRLSAVDTVYAMTVHKSQGSQFDTAAVLLPGVDSRLLTRELLYTAVTRAQEHLVLVGEEAAVVAAVEKPIARASGLAARLGI